MAAPREHRRGASFGKTTPGLKEAHDELRTKLRTRINGATSQQLELWAQAMLPIPGRDNSLICPEPHHFQPASTKARVVPTVDTTGEVNPAKDRLNRLGLCVERPMGEVLTEDPRRPDKAGSDVQYMTARKILVSDSHSVGQFLDDRIRRLQQIPIKRIAKAWIKGICPKKQTLYPYKKKGNDDEPQPLTKPPPWWPSEEVCQFREPDHIGRRERIALCQHILRLRPTPATLSAWNGGKVPPSSVHVTEGWTEFLMRLAPISILEEFQDVSDEKTQRRRELLQQLYHVARLEEDYQDGAVDDDYTFTYQEPEERQSKKLKRSRKMSPTSKNGDRSRSSSSTGSRVPAKKLRRTAPNDTQNIASPVALKDEPEDWMDTEVDSDMDAECTPDLETSFNTTTSASTEASSRQLPGPSILGDSNPIVHVPRPSQVNTSSSRGDVGRGNVDIQAPQQAVGLPKSDCRANGQVATISDGKQRLLFHPTTEAAPNSQVAMPDMPGFARPPHPVDVAVYQNVQVPQPDFGPVQPMPAWSQPGMPAMQQEVDMFGNPMMAGQVMAMAPHPYLVPGAAFPIENYTCDPHTTMMPFSQDYYQPPFLWPGDDNHQAAEAMQLTRSFGSGCM